MTTRPTRKFAEVNDTLTKAELAALSDVMPDNDDAVPTTGATKDYIDHVIETDILVDGTGLNKSGSGGQVTIGISAGSVDLDRIKAEDIITSAEANPNNDTTIATTAKIDDMIDAAITGDIASDGTGITVTDDGDGECCICHLHLANYFHSRTTHGLHIWYHQSTANHLGNHRNLLLDRA